MYSIPFPNERTRMSILVKRKEGMTKEEFVKYLVEEHGPLFAATDIAKKNILKYEHGFTHPNSTDFAKAFGLYIPDYSFDAIVVIEAESFEKLKETFNSKEYLEKVAGDEGVFVDRSKCHVLIQQVHGVI